MGGDLELTSQQQQATWYFARRYFGLLPGEWDALPAEVKQIYLSQPIGVDD